MMSEMTPGRLELIRARLHWHEVGATYYGRRRGPGGQASGPVACGHTSDVGSPCCRPCYTALLDHAPDDLRDLLAEVERLQAEIEPRIERSIAFQDAMEEAEAQRDEALAEVKRLREVRQRGCDCNDEDACRFARERDTAYRTGQEAMRERAAAVCRDWPGLTPDTAWCVDRAIRALEVG